MGIFLSVALAIYGCMHLYAFSKIWIAFPHSHGLALGLVLVLAGTVLTCSPLPVWFLQQHSGDRAAAAAAWVSYAWMGYLFLFLYGLAALPHVGPPVRLFAAPEITLITIKGKGR